MRGGKKSKSNPVEMVGLDEALNVCVGCFNIRSQGGQGVYTKHAAIRSRTGPELYLTRFGLITRV